MKLSLRQFAQLFAFTAVLFSGIGTAQQVATGTPRFGSFGGGPFDAVNLGNLNVHFAIPVLHKAGRGMPFQYDLTYDSSVWKTAILNGVTQWTPTPNFGWQTGAPFGYVTYSESSTDCYYTPPSPPWNGTQIYAYTVYQEANWAFVDRSGVSHPIILNSPGYTSKWAGNTSIYAPCNGTPTTYPSGTGSTTDGSGYTISIVNTTTATVTSPSGIQAGQSTITDANGNKMSSNTSGQYFDTLSSTVPVLTVAGSAPSPTTFTYAAPSGSASFKMNYVNYTVATAFGVTLGGSTIHEYGPLAKYLVDNVTLPDGTQYKFTYEPGPGSCVLQSGTSACVTARIASVTLPTGGVITYTYSGGTNNTGILSDGSTAGLTRMLTPTTACAGTNPTGCWQYSRAQLSGPPGPGSTWTTTVTDPIGNQSFLNFVEDSTTTTSTTTATYNLFETQRKVYQGLISTTNCSVTSTTNCLLSTIVTCYIPYVSSCPTTAVSSPITYKTVTKQYPDSTGSASVVSANIGTFGLPTTIWAGNATQTLQVTNISYASLGNIVDHPSLVTVVDGSSNLKSETSYSYDEPAYPLQTMTGAPTPQHTSVTGSRGNATTITYYTTSSATLAKHFQYYDTGTLYRSQDVNGSSTIYTSYTYDQTAQGSTTKSCGNSFPTTITSPPTPNAPSGLSVSTTWDCTGGVVTSSTDPNGMTVGATYSDPYFWRPASNQDQSLNTTTFAYTPASGGTPASMESKMLFNTGNSSISEQLTTVDLFGRMSLSQQEEGPSSTSYDTIQAAYDTLGRPYQSSMPFVSTAGQGSGTAPVTTRSYDALGRVIQAQDAGSGYVSYSYSQNDVLQTIGPKPGTTGSLKLKQLESDALGRLISVCEITAGTTAAPSGGCNQKTALPSPPGAGYLTTYTYGVNGSLLPQMTVAQNTQTGSSGPQSRSYVYDLMGRMIQETNPETGNHSPGTSNYYFDSDSTGVCPGTYKGDLVKVVDNRLNITCYTYDSLHRVQTITYASTSPDYANSQAKTYVYDAASYSSTAMSYAIGRMAEAYTGPSASKVTDEFFSYSKRGEITDVYQHSTNSGATYYHATAGYWANGALNTLSSNIANLPTQTFGVDAMGRPSTVTATSSQNPIVVKSTVYDLVHYNTTVTYGSLDSDVFTFDPRTGRLKQYQFNVGSNSDTGTLTWFSNGALGALQIVDTVPGTTDSQNCSYAHDDLSRVSSVNCGNTLWRQNFSYDAFGNVSKDSTGYTGLTFAASYTSSTNQFTTIGSVTPTYDTDGRLTYDGANHYTWDVDSKLHTVDTSPSSTITYDALGRMVEKALGTTYTQIVYGPSGSKLAVMSAQTMQKAFIPLPGGGTAVYTATGLAYYRHTDHLGSSRLATTPSRTLYSSTAYAPFGEPYAQTGTTDLSFTGQDQDTVSGMHDFLARRYTSTSGRWLSPDPAGIGAVDPSNPQTWNRYAYVMNNPLSFVDPFGEMCYWDGYCADGGSLSPLVGGGGGFDQFQLSGIPSGDSFNVTQYDFSGSQNFQWTNYGLSELLNFARQGEISLDAVTSLGVIGFQSGIPGDNGLGFAGSGGGKKKGKEVQLVVAQCRDPHQPFTPNAILGGSWAPPEKILPVLSDWLEVGNASNGGHCGPRPGYPAQQCYYQPIPGTACSNVMCPGFTRTTNKSYDAFQDAFPIEAVGQVCVIMKNR